MTTGQPHPVLRFIQRLAARPPGGETTDTQLLHRFHTRHDEAAFAELVQRHGPLVLSVCRRVLRDEHDADDAFQATFLVLARKAGSLGRPWLLGNWLYGVACRTAAKAKVEAARRRARERQVVDLPATHSQPDGDGSGHELRPLLDEELRRLPEKYRVPLVLCYLEGKTYAEAARVLGWAEGTVSGRLARARDLLRTRLARRGLAVSAGALVSGLAADVARACVSPALAQSTARAAMLFAAGQAAAGIVPAKVAALSEGVLKMMFVNRLKNWAALALAVSIAVVGGGLLAHHVLATPGSEDRKPDTSPPVAGRGDEPRGGEATPLGAWKVVAMEVDGKTLAEGAFSLRTVEIAEAKEEGKEFWGLTANKAGYTITMAGGDDAPEVQSCAGGGQGAERNRHRRERGDAGGCPPEGDLPIRERPAGDLLGGESERGRCGRKAAHGIRGKGRLHAGGPGAAITPSGAASAPRVMGLASGAASAPRVCKDSGR